MDELKQVVDSVEIVSKHGEFGFTDLSALEKAITDYKLVESYKELDNG